MWKKSRFFAFLLTNLSTSFRFRGLSKTKLTKNGTTLFAVHVRKSNNNDLFFLSRSGNTTQLSNCFLCCFKHSCRWEVVLFWDKIVSSRREEKNKLFIAQDYRSALAKFSIGESSFLSEQGFGICLCWQFFAPAPPGEEKCSQNKELKTREGELFTPCCCSLIVI